MPGLEARPRSPESKVFPRLFLLPLRHRFIDTYKAENPVNWQVLRNIYTHPDQSENSESLTENTCVNFTARVTLLPYWFESNAMFLSPTGYLSRTGLCVKPENNFKIKDPRLNFWGVAYVLPDDVNPKCTESECSEDSHCDADRKCCRNYCGGMVCTPTSKHYTNYEERYWARLTRSPG